MVEVTIKHTHTDFVLRKIFRLSRILGTFPFGHDFVVSRRRLVCSTCLVLSISVGCCTMQFYNNTHLRRVIKILFTAFVNVLSLAILVMRRAGVLSIYQTLRKIEQELLAEGVLWDWVPISVRIYHSQIIFFSMFLFTVLARLNHDTGWTVSFICAYMFSFPLSLSVISQFTMLQAVFSSLFDQIVQLNDVTRALVVFSQLSSASDTLKSMYGLQTLLYTTATFIFIVCNLYYELAHPLNIRPIFDLTDIIHFVWILVIFYTFLDIIVSCNRTVSKARKVNEVLFERMVEDTTNSLINNELLEFHLTSYRELEFTACGYFTLDNSLICSMIACATTYLVILLQYIHPELAAGGSSNNTSY